MFQRLIDDVKESTGNAVRMTSLAAAAGVALLITTAFLCAAAFMFVLDVTDRSRPVSRARRSSSSSRRSPPAATWRASVRSGPRRAGSEKAERLPKPRRSSLLADPAMLAIALQVVRAIGIKRLVPILAIGGVALGVLAARGQRRRRRSRRSNFGGAANFAAVPATTFP